MEDLNSYNLEAIYQMMREGSISIDMLAKYIENVVPNMGDSEQVRAFLQAANDYVDRKIKAAGVEENEPRPQVDENSTMEAPEINDQEVDEDLIVEEPEMTDQQAVAIEQPELSTEPPIDTPNEVVNDEISNAYSDAGKAIDQTYRYCQYAGMQVEEISLNGKNGRGPYISFEINNESKQFLDHLMMEFYQNSDDVSLEFMRDMSTKSEMFTIEIGNSDNKNPDDFYTHVKDTFDRIANTVQTTRRDFDYESNMPQGLKNIKDRFRNDDPDIGQDFTIGYVRNDGKDSYYIVADDYSSAVEYARSIGYDIKNSQGVNIFEIATNGSVTNTKLEDASIDLSNDRDARDVKNNGVSNLDIYDSLNTDPKVELIQNFIETSNDPHFMCILEIEIPPENTNQRVVKLKDETGGNEILVFTDGDSFDQKIMPKIIDSYTDNNKVYDENVTIYDGNRSGVVSCQIDSENNTTVLINGYSEESVQNLVNDITAKTKINEENANTYNNTRQKTIGTYPTNNKSDEKASAFVSMPVLFAILILFILMISLIVFSV